MRLILPRVHDDLGTDDLISLYEPPTNRLFVRANMVSSIDGAVTVEGKSAGLSSEVDKQVFKILRMHCDVLLTGAGTVQIEGYGALKLSPDRIDWRRTHGKPAYPTMSVVTRTGTLDPAAAIFTEAPVRPIVITCDAAPIDRVMALSRVADVIIAGDKDVDFGLAFQELADRGLSQVLSEGGPHIVGSLTKANMLDELCLTVSPLLTGSGAGRITAGPSTPVRRMNLAHVIEADSNLLLRYERLP